ncbi:MAG: DMT family transporter [Roseibacillus sp.]
MLALTAVLGRIISIEAPSLVFWRVFIAGLAMALWLAAINPALLCLPRRRLLTVLGLGMLQGAHWVCFFWSISLSNVSVALAAFATISLFTAITEPLIERRPIRPGELLCGGIVIAGILLIAGNLGDDHRLGLAVGLVGALLHSIFPVLNRRLVARGTPSRSMLLYEMAGACLMAALALPFITPYHFQFPTGRDWLPLLTLALLCTTVAHTWNIHLLGRLTAYTANLTMNFEPVWGILLGVMLFQEHEQLHFAFYPGTALIIVANFLDPWLKKRRKSPLAASGLGQDRN